MLRGIRLSRIVDTTGWRRDKTDWLQEGHSGSFPVRPSLFKAKIMQHPDGYLSVKEDGAMILYNSERNEIARSRIAIDKLHYESGIHYT